MVSPLLVTRSSVPPAQLRQWLRLNLVTDQASLQGRCLTDVVLAAVQGGVSSVQLREKTLSTRDF